MKRAKRERKKKRALKRLKQNMSLKQIKAAGLR